MTRQRMCGQCGARAVADGDERQESGQCGLPRGSAETTIAHEEKLQRIRYALELLQGGWASGHIEFSEVLAEAAA